MVMGWDLWCGDDMQEGQRGMWSVRQMWVGGRKWMGHNER